MKNRLTTPLVVALLSLFTGNSFAQDSIVRARKHLWELQSSAGYLYSNEGVSNGIESWMGVGVRYAFRGYGIGIGMNKLTMAGGQGISELFITVNAQWKRHSADFLIGSGGTGSGSSDFGASRMSVAYAYRLKTHFALCGIYIIDGCSQVTQTPGTYDMWTNTSTYWEYYFDAQNWRAFAGARLQHELPVGLFGEFTMMLGLDHSKYSSETIVSQRTGWTITSSRSYDAATRDPVVGLAFAIEAKAGWRLGRKAGEGK